MDILLKVLHVIEDNYPETLKQCYVINGIVYLYISTINNNNNCL